MAEEVSIQAQVNAEIAALFIHFLCYTWHEAPMVG